MTNIVGTIGRTGAVVLIVCFMLAWCTGRPSGVVPVTPFDIQRYAGTWYEIMRLDHGFERGLTNVTATYTINNDETVDVINRRFDPDKCNWNEIKGVAKFQGSPFTASLSVTFFWPFMGSYHVIDLDDDYRWAAVSGPSTRYFWILARKPFMDADLRSQLVDKARKLGFPVTELIFVEQGAVNCAKDN